jgi:hypothetical protein
MNSRRPRTPGGDEVTSLTFSPELEPPYVGSYDIYDDNGCSAERLSSFAEAENPLGDMKKSFGGRQNRFEVVPTGFRDMLTWFRAGQTGFGGMQKAFGEAKTAWLADKTMTEAAVMAVTGPHKLLQGR